MFISLPRCNSINYKHLPHKVGVRVKMMMITKVLEQSQHTHVSIFMLLCWGIHPYYTGRIVSNITCSSDLRKIILMLKFQEVRRSRECHWLRTCHSSGWWKTNGWRSGASSSAQTTPWFIIASLAWCHGIRPKVIIFHPHLCLWSWLSP